MRRIAVLLFLHIQFALLWAQGTPSTGVVTIDGREVTYQLRGGYAVIEGDIIIGTPGRMPTDSGLKEQARLLPQSAGQIFFGGLPAHWPNATMYYTIDSDLPNPSRILNAIDHWNTRTPFKILARTTEPNYVRFERGGATDLACLSSIGMVGGPQTIVLPDGCSAGNVIHEIGHAWGLLHEQSRNDRNANVTVLFENIDKRFASNFFQSLSDTQDAGYYDFDSIMHYGFSDFSANNLDTLDSVPLGIPFGQIVRLSAGDIDGISRMYGFTPANTTVTTIPEGLPIVVDGVSGVSPQSFAWAPGSAHTVSVTVEFGTDPHYRLVSWSDAGDATHTVTASAATTVFCAIFERLYQVSAAVQSGNGTVSIAPSSPDGYYPERMAVRIAAIPGPGSKLLGWSGPNIQNFGYGLASDTATVDVTLANSGFAAVFTSQVVTTIDSEPQGRQVLVDNAPFLTPCRFTWIAGSTHSLSTVAVQSGSTGASQYLFTGWEDGSTQAGRSVVAGSSDAALKASFKTRYLLSTTTTGPGNVTVSPPSADGFYDAGTDVQLNSFPNFGSILRFWLGDLLGDDAVKTLKMDQPKSVRAGFGPAIGFFVLHAGSFQFNPVFGSSTPSVAPGEIVAIFSHNVIAPIPDTNGQVQDGKVTTTLDGTQVLFDGVPAPLLFGQQADFLQAVVPASVAGKSTTTVRIVRNGTQVAEAIPFSVQETFPGIFTADNGKGQVRALNEDSSFNSATNPAAPGSIISFYMTGGGLPATPVADGQVMGFDPAGLKAPVYVRVGKLPVAELRYAASVATLVNGVLFVQIRLPKELLGGPAIPVQVIFGNYASPPGATIAVQ